MSYHNEELSDEEGLIHICMGGMLLFWWLPIPFISGIACNIAEIKLIETMMTRYGVSETEASASQIFWAYHLRNPFLWMGTYVPYIGIPCQYIEVRRLTKFTKYFITNKKQKGKTILAWILAVIFLCVIIIPFLIDRIEKPVVSKDAVVAPKTEVVEPKTEVPASAPAPAHEEYNNVLQGNGTVAEEKQLIKTDTYNSGEKIQVYYYNAPGDSRDWICIVPEGADNREAGDYKYIPGSGRGVLTFESPQPGKYEARAYYRYSSFKYEITARYPFTVQNY